MQVDTIRDMQEQVNILHILRVGNAVADWLAWFGTCNSVTEVFFEDF